MSDEPFAPRVASSATLQPSPPLTRARETSEEKSAPATDLFASLRELAAKELSPELFVGEAFRTITRVLRAPYALLRASVSNRAIEDYWHSGATDPSFWKSSVGASLDNSIASASATARLYRAKNGAGGVVVIASPLSDASGEVSGAIGIVLECDDERRGHELLTLLRAVTTMIPVLSGAIARQRACGARSATGASNETVRALAIAAKSHSQHAIAIAMTNQLRAKIGCQQVSLATVVGRQLKLLAVSGFAEVSERAPGVAVMLAAMCEALDARRVVHWSPAAQTTDYALHRRWSSETDGASVATIPLRSDERIVALLSLRHEPGRQFAENDLKMILEAATPYVATLDLVHRATRSVAVHAAEASRSALRDSFRAKRVVRTSLIGLAAAGLGWFAFGTTIDHVTAHCRICAASSMHLAAPFNGTLREATVVAGDEVTANQMVARFDTAELELERHRLVAAIEKASIEADLARSKGGVAEAMLIDARAEVDQAYLRTVDRKIAQATIRVPADGVILTGDLRKLIGNSVPTGQTLFEFAPNGALKVELSIADRDIARLHAGATGEFVSTARPDVHIPITLSRIRRAAELRDGQNVFVAEAALNAPEPWMRAGVDGFAKVETGTVPVWKSYLRRAIDFVRIHLWV